MLALHRLASTSCWSWLNHSRSDYPITREHVRPNLPAHAARATILQQ
jgi:hypothetical protein